MLSVYLKGLIDLDFEIYFSSPNITTVKPVLKATCIKQSPVLKGHYFWSH